MQESNCLIIAGEKSGEEHCLSFFKELKKKCPGTHFWGVGGDEMISLGFENLYHLKDFSSWGFSEVIGKIPFYFKALKNIENEVVKRNCEYAILIDFQDFNLRLAKKLKKRGVKVLYYVAPQAWAWKAWRAKALSKCIHTLFTIIPFEKKWFNERGVEKVIGIDHPVYLTYKNELQSSLRERSFADFTDELNLLLLPGSRNFEVKGLLTDFIKTVNLLRKSGKKVNVSIVKSPNVNKNLYAPYESFFDKVYESEELTKALQKADMALAASGTVTLACALFEVPTVVCYHSSFFNEFIFYTFLNYDWFISLANIVHENELFPELIQEFSSSHNMYHQLKRWIDDEVLYKATLKELVKTKELVHGEMSDVSAYISEVING